tara:strand:+ start:138 stop:500 length:363 start_codon:yes stop_codon:yes gene_type:complete
MWDGEIEFNRLEGLVIFNIHQKGDEEIVFTTNCGKKFRMFHDQDCCEHVRIEEIVGGELQDLVGEKILLAEEVSNQEDGDWETSKTWTFYKISTNSTSLTIRWLGESNGYYSERVSFVEL